MKCLTGTVTDRSDDAPGSYIESEYQISGIFLFILLFILFVEEILFEFFLYDVSNIIDFARDIALIFVFMKFKVLFISFFNFY